MDEEQGLALSLLTVIIIRLECFLLPSFFS